MTDLVVVIRILLQGHGVLQVRRAVGVLAAQVVDFCMAAVIGVQEAGDLLHRVPVQHCRHERDTAAGTRLRWRAGVRMARVLLLRLTLLALRRQPHGNHPGGDVCQVQVKASILEALLLA
jgi:hypothetical protein